MTDRYTALVSGSIDFNPEVIGDIIWDTTYAELGLFQSPAVRELQADFTNGGSTATFPVFQGLAGDFEALDCTDSTGANPTVTYAEMTYETKDVISKIIDVGIKGCTLDDAIKNRRFNIVDACLQEVAAKAMKVIDLALITEAETTTLIHTVAASGPITRSAVIKAKAKWGDMLGQNSTLVLHSAQAATLLDEAKDVPMYNGNVWLPSATGQLPVVCGCPLVVSDNITKATNDYTGLLVANGGLGFKEIRMLDYKVIQQTGDKAVHEFVVRFVVKLYKRNGKLMAVKLVSRES
jgi:hypothetical protein